MRGVANGGSAQDVDEFKPILRPQGVRIGLIKSKVPENAPRKPAIGSA